MNNPKRGDSQQMEKLAAAPSNWRILNLNRAMRALRDRQGPNAPGFFRNKRLSSSIIIKHTLRDHERGMFEKAPIVATKVLVPMDESALSAGAISFFVGEKAYPAIMRQSFAINVAGPGCERDRDASILRKLDEAPSLEVFLLRELLGSPAFGISGDYFHVSLLEDAAIKSYITAELAPLIRIAVDRADPATVNRFVDSIFGHEIGRQAADFFQTLGLASGLWANVVFAWKAALFYETQFAATQQRFEAMRQDLARLRTYGHNEVYPRSLVERLLADLRGFADRAYEQSLASARRFNSAKRAAIIQKGSIVELSSYLQSLPASVMGFGAYRAVLDHILSYWLYRTRGLNYARMPAEVFASVAWDICAMEHQFKVITDSPEQLRA